MQCNKMNTAKLLKKPNNQYSVEKIHNKKYFELWID